MLRQLDHGGHEFWVSHRTQRVTVSHQVEPNLRGHDVFRAHFLRLSFTYALTSRKCSLHRKRNRSVDWLFPRRRVSRCFWSLFVQVILMFTPCYFVATDPQPYVSFNPTSPYGKLDSHGQAITADSNGSSGTGCSTSIAGRFSSEQLSCFGYRN